MRRAVPGQEGAALLVVLGAMAALAVPTAALLTAAHLTYAIETYLTEVEQARLLTLAVRRQVEAAVLRGDLPEPTSRTPVEIRNGRYLPDGRSVQAALIPRPSGTDWPRTTELPASPNGVGAEVTLVCVLGPRGDHRGTRGTVRGPGEGMLVDVEIRVWFRRAVHQERWRYLRTPETFQRLD